MGEQNHWAKCTNFDNAVHAPLIFMLPPHLRAVPATFLAVPTEVRKKAFFALFLRTLEGDPFAKTGSGQI